MKISIVTPVFNMASTLEETILSVLNQNYPDLEYIIIDGGSTDGTIEIIEKYQHYLSFWLSEPDKGMYDALNKGLQKSSGDIMMWINADDLLMPNSFYLINKTFVELPSVEWIQGYNSFVDANGIPVPTQSGKSFSRLKYYKYDFKWIQQESTVWKRTLWQKSGSEVNSTLKFAGDLGLWVTFFNHAHLYNTSYPIGAFRKRKGQLSETEFENYLNETNSILSKTKLVESDLRLDRKINKWFLLKRIFFWNNFLKNAIENKISYQLRGKTIVYSYASRKFKIHYG